MCNMAIYDGTNDYNSPSMVCYGNNDARDSDLNRYIRIPRSTLLLSM